MKKEISKKEFMERLIGECNGFFSDRERTLEQWWLSMEEISQMNYVSARRQKEDGVK